MRHSLLHTVGNVVWTARSHRRGALPLLRTYTRLKLGELARSGGRGEAPARTRILDLEVTFFDRYWLVEMFEEIFLRRQYYFEASNRRPVVLDVGSNIGLSILYFKALYPEASVTGFEPDPEAFDVLTRNVQANRLADVTLVNAAVHDGRTTVVLHKSRQTRGSPQASTSVEREVGEAISVPAERLSAYVRGPIDLLKLDIEGAEGKVLEELERAGRLSLVRRIALEYHHHLEQERDALSEVLSLLERNDFGYQLEARLDTSNSGRSAVYQNVLVHAYRKGARGARA